MIPTQQTHWPYKAEMESLNMNRVKCLVALAFLLAFSFQPTMHAQQSCGFVMDPTTGEAQSTCNTVEYASNPGNGLTYVGTLPYGSNQVTTQSAPFNWSTAYKCAAEACGAMGATAILTSWLNGGLGTTAEKFTIGCTIAFAGCVITEGLRSNSDIFHVLGDDSAGTNVCYETEGSMYLHGWFDDSSTCSVRGNE